MERTDEVAKRIEKIVNETEGVAFSTMVVGYSMLTQSYSTNNAFVFISLKDWAEREKTAKELIQQTNLALSEIQFHRCNGNCFRSTTNRRAWELQQVLRYNFSIDPETRLSSWIRQARNFIAEAKKRPEIGSAFTLYRSNVPQKQVVIDFDKAEKLNIDLTEINSTISTYLGSSYVNDFNRFGRQYKVFVQAEAEDRLNPSDICKLLCTQS
jgi:HAE1 family hydrophobic/amphiphilic exporter-1